MIRIWWASRPGDLARIVGQDADGRHALIVEDGRGVVVCSAVVRKTQVKIRLDRIHPLVLQCVRQYLVRQPDSPAFLPHVDQARRGVPVRSSSSVA